MGKRLIYCSFATLDGYVGSANFSQSSKSIDVYLKNACVSCFTAKKHNPDCDVAFVHNLKVLPTEIQTFFDKYKILSIYVEYTNFLFSADYKWSLAFYKLCALKYLIYQSTYDCLIAMDTDTFVIGNLNACFTVAENRLMLYNVQHPYDLEAFEQRLKEYRELYGGNNIPTVYGGEFIAGNNKDLRKFIYGCEEVYNFLIEKNFETKFGDEFITFCAAEKYSGKIADASPYVRRYWTTNLYYQCFTDHSLALRVLHVPNEKNNAFIRLYNYILKHGDVPKKSKTFKMFGFPKTVRPKYFCNFLYQFKRKIKKLIKGK